MARIGIICEYNPFHNGHAKQISLAKQAFPEASVVCLMSGNYVQRGHPAIVDKSIRAKAALDNGADLVLELPITYALSSAEGFAQGGVEILTQIGCTHLCFGSESGNGGALMETARQLLTPAFSSALRENLNQGLSFPAARARALRGNCPGTPNDILGVEYCKATLRLCSTMVPFPIRREGDYHNTEADPRNPSATALRRLMEQGQDWRPYSPAFDIQSQGGLHLLSYGERAILATLRTMPDEAFEALPYGSEGLWRKLMHASRRCATLEEILTEVKSKRYTRTRLDRMVMCAFLGITASDLQTPAPYVRILAMNDRGRTIVKERKESARLVNPGQRLEGSYWEVERRSGDLYGIFAQIPAPPGAEDRRRLWYEK